MIRGDGIRALLLGSVVDPLFEHLDAQVGGIHLLGAGHRAVVPHLRVRLLECRLLLRHGGQGAGGILDHGTELHRRLLRPLQ
jgi:hypothetical protein